MEGLFLANYDNYINVDTLDIDNELCIEVTNKDNDCAHIYLSLNQTNELINYLVKQLQTIGEPVEALNVAK